MRATSEGSKERPTGWQLEDRGRTPAMLLTVTQLPRAEERVHPLEREGAAGAAPDEEGAPRGRRLIGRADAQHLVRGDPGRLRGRSPSSVSV